MLKFALLIELLNGPENASMALESRVYRSPGDETTSRGGR